MSLRRTERARGFTLLEVMIAMAILSVSLVALAGVNSSALNMHAYAKKLTVATMLARGKMADIEQELQSDGFPMEDDEQDGTFEEEGFPSFAWKAQIIKPKTEEIDVTRLLQNFGMDGADGNSPLAALGGLSGGGDAKGQAAAMASSAGMLGGMMQTQLKTMLDQLGQQLREVRLTVSWKDGSKTESFTVATHVISLGQGTDQATSDALLNNPNLTRGLPNK